MADTKLSALTAASSVATTDFVYVVQGTTSVQATVAQVLAAAGLSTDGTTLSSAQPVKALVSDAGTTTAAAALTVGHDTSGTAAGGFGTSVLIQAQDSTTADTNAARVTATWATATHATRKARLALFASDAAGDREGVRVEADGAAPLLGFYGVAAVARAVLATGAAHTADDVITALQNLGLVKQS